MKKLRKFLFFCTYDIVNLLANIFGELKPRKIIRTENVLGEKNIGSA